MTFGRWSGHDGEAGERALFARRARALPAPALPSLEEIVAKAAAPSAPPSGRRPSRHAGTVIGLATLAAACVGGLVVASAHAAGNSGGRAIVADSDAGTSYFTQGGLVSQAGGGGETCEPSADTARDDDGATCASPQATFVLASYDDHSRACTGAVESSCSSPSGAPLSCDHERELVCTP